MRCRLFLTALSNGSSQAVREDLRAMYDAAPGKPHRDESCDIALHVRRGDVTAADHR